MPIEHYRTDRGSRVEIAGEHRGIVTIEFDWCEEGACVEARPVADVERLYWSCTCCSEGGSNQLLRCE